jgi:hypothetical protein
VGRLLFNVLAMVAEFEADLIRLRTPEGMKVAKAKGRLRGKQPKLKPNQAKHLLDTPKVSSPNSSASGHGVPDHRADAAQATRTAAAIRPSRAPSGVSPRPLTSRADGPRIEYGQPVLRLATSRCLSCGTQPAKVGCPDLASERGGPASVD